MLQGQSSQTTIDAINDYLKLDFVNKIFLSTYPDVILSSLPSKVIVLENLPLENPGIGNRNLQINTSRRGLALVESPFAVKMRADQHISFQSMMSMYNFWLNSRSFFGRIYVLGMYTKFPYHPRDHLFWGKTEDLISLFAIPFHTSKSNAQNYKKYVRAETYIGQYYYAKFDDRVENHINNPTVYLVDDAPLHHEALKLDFEIRHKVFAPFPRIEMRWPKHGLTEYHYERVFCSTTEYWDGE